MTTYAHLLKFDGTPREDMVLRDDGVLVLTYSGIVDADPPLDPAPVLDKDAAAYRAWLDQGGLVGEAVPTPAPVVVPDSASRLGLMRALREIGKWDAAKQAIASNADAQEEWDLAISIKRDDPLTAGIIAALGLTSADVDKLLIRAAALTG